jgi:hypothetical protein
VVRKDSPLSLLLIYLRAAEWFNSQNRHPTPVPQLTESPKVSELISRKSSLTNASKPMLTLQNSPHSSLRTLAPTGVAEWLREHNLGRYAEIFEENEISGDILSQLSSQMLKSELGVAPFGHRFVIMKAFNKVFAPNERKVRA